MSSQGRWTQASLPFPPRRERLGPGGWIGFGRTGHLEVTRDAAEEFGFSSAAVEILADASQDPDFYEFHHPEAHAQSPDALNAIPTGDHRAAETEKAITNYLGWIVGHVMRIQAGQAAGDLRAALYWLGYVLHGVEDLAPHQGRTNAEHAFNDPSPDYVAENIELARHYARALLRALRDTLGADGFDALRDYRGPGSFGRAEKVQRLHGHGWDLSPEGFAAYERSGKDYGKAKPRPEPVRWSREYVLGRVLDELASLAPTSRGAADPVAARKSAATRGRRPADLPLGDGTADRAPPPRGFEALAPSHEVPEVAEWTVMVYMAGDDQNPNGIEYAVRQDLGEMKEVGSTAQVNLLAQTDEAHDVSSYRYRLRKGTTLETDRLQVFRGDLNTGRVSTLVDFVAWAAKTHPARHYALVLWGHGSGHDDQDVYSLVRGKVSPRLATQLARGRLGFFGSTRRSLLERGGPNRGYGFDSTAADFLDNIELRRALRKITKDILHQPLDLLGFDACLMAMVEVAYQLRDTTKVLVASQRTEPGDGWTYGSALRRLQRKPTDTDAEQLAKDIVSTYRHEYGLGTTLSALRMDRIEDFRRELAPLARGLRRPTFDKARRAAEDCSPLGADGYRDLGGFLKAAGPLAAPARKVLKEMVIAKTGARTFGLSAYLPGDYRPDLAGRTDELYEQMDFAREAGWALLLRRMYPAPGKSAPVKVVPATPLPGSRYGLDSYNAYEVLAGLQMTGGPAKGRSREESRISWADAPRASLMAPLSSMFQPMLELLARDRGPDPDLRIFVLPGIMGSMLSDRRGHHGLVWIDPVGLTIGRDFEALRLSPDGTQDADAATLLRAAAAVPLIYDRLSLALMGSFGPCVEHLPYDWRRPIGDSGRQVARRIKSFLGEAPGRRVVLVGHSMGGLVAADALSHLAPSERNGVRGLVTLGTPWLGSFDAFLALTARSEQVQMFQTLTLRDAEDIEKVVQTFWGLSDLMPVEEVAGEAPAAYRPAPVFLQQAASYAPGPLARSPHASAQLASRERLSRTTGTKVPVLSLFSDCHNTVIGMTVDGDQLELDLGPGDGTVSQMSATTNGKVTARKLSLGKHMLLPLYREAIQATILGIRGFVDEPGSGRASRKPFKLPDWPEELDRFDRQTGRECLMDHLEERGPRTLDVGDLAALMPLG